MTTPRNDARLAEWQAEKDARIAKWQAKQAKARAAFEKAGPEARITLIEAEATPRYPADREAHLRQLGGDQRWYFGRLVRGAQIGSLSLVTMPLHHIDEHGRLACAEEIEQADAGPPGDDDFGAGVGEVSGCLDGSAVVAGVGIAEHDDAHPAHFCSLPSVLEMSSWRK